MSIWAFCSLPTKLVGRNRLWRAFVIQSIEKDPAWEGGEYKAEPVEGLRVAAIMLAIAGSAPIQMQKDLPTREAADALAARTLDNAAKAADANDLIYQVDASLARQHPGAGMGLAIVKHVGYAHGGQVTVRSAPGQGSAFTLVLPRS